MKQADKDSTMKLTDEEKDMLRAYLLDYVHASEIASKLQYALRNLQKMALYARNLSPETHRITDSYTIKEIKEDLDSGAKGSE